MRTKALILTAAFSAVGIASSMGQVFSVNGVGYYNLDLPQGFSAIANQLNATPDNTLPSIIPDAPVGTTVAKWDVVGQTYLPTDFFNGDDPLFGGWRDGALNPSTTELAPGEGAFINMAAAGTLTFVGEIPQGTGPEALSVSISPNFNLISQPTPQSAGLDATGLPATVGDTVLFWDTVTQNFAAALFFNGDDPVFGGWRDGALNAVDPTPAVGESFFYNSGAASAVDWTRDFSIND